MRRNKTILRILVAIPALFGASDALAAQTDGLAYSLMFASLCVSVIALAGWYSSRRRNPSSSILMAEGAVLEAASAGYCVIDTRRHHLVVSPNLHRLLGITVTLTRWEQLIAAFPYAQQQQLDQARDQLKLGKPVAPMLLTPGDSGKYLECHLSVKADASGVITLLALWFSDVTEPQKIKQRLAQENEKLKNELRNYSTILNMAPYPIWQRNAALSVGFYNLAYNEAVEDISEKSPDSETPELDKRVRSIARQALETGQPVSERHHIIVGGERKLYEITELPVPEEHILVGFGVDITELELLQEDLQRHISAQADLLESSASAMAIYGPDMRLRSFNYAFVSLWKLDETWLDTQPTYGEILEALREKRKLPEQANFQLFKQQQLKQFTQLIEPREEFFYLPDGKALRVIAIPHALGGILFAYEDVTDRLALERSYNTLIAVQRETLDNLHEGVAVFGEDGRLKLSNPIYLKLWHIDKSFAQGEPHLSEILDLCRALYLYDDWDSYKKHLLMQAHNREHGYHRIERRDGKVIDWAVVPLPDGATLVTYLDVTDSTLVERSLRERNEALQEADKLKTEFLANVSYELRSPLTSISGFSEMLKQEYFGSLSEKQKEYVEGIYQSSQHLMQLINDILDLASIEAGYMRLEVAKFDIHAMMKSVLSLIQERSKEHNIQVKFECPARIGKIMGDETRIKQILFNLLSNAIKYSGAGDTISLGAKEMESGDIMLWVSDQGQGIPQEEQDMIFSKFYRGRNQDNQKHKGGKRSGTGLGLSIVKNFIELHGGTVSLESEEGKGSRFMCILPRIHGGSPAQKPGL